MGAKYVKYTYTPGAPGVLVIRQRSTGYLRDDADGSFTATPTTNYAVATEDADIPGLYSWTTSDVWTDDYYEAYWYTTPALTSTCRLLGVIQLVGDEEVSQSAVIDTAAIAAAVRDVDNSTPAAGSLGHDVAAAAADEGGGGTCTCGGSGGIQFTWTEYQQGHNNDPNYVVPDVRVVVYTNNQAIGTPEAKGVTDETGQVQFFLDPGTYYLFRRKSGRSFNNPVTVEVS